MGFKGTYVASGGEIANDIIEARHIVAGTITATEITVTNLAAISTNTGDLTVTGTIVTGSSGEFLEINTSDDLAFKTLVGFPPVPVKVATINNNPTGLNIWGADHVTIKTQGSPTTVASFSSNGLAVPVGDIKGTLSRLILFVGGQLEISSGEITVTHSKHTIDTEGGAANDDLLTINGGIAGQILILQSANNSREVTLIDNTGNLWLAGNFTLSGTKDSITLVCEGVKWREIARSSNQ